MSDQRPCEEDRLKDWAETAVDHLFNDDVFVIELKDGGPPYAIVLEEDFQVPVIMGRGASWPEAVEKAWSRYGTSLRKKVSPPTPPYKGDEHIEEFCQAMRQRDLMTEFLLWYGEKGDKDPDSYPRALTRGEWFEQLGEFISGVDE